MITKQHVSNQIRSLANRVEDRFSFLRRDNEVNAEKQPAVEKERGSDMSLTFKVCGAALVAFVASVSLVAFGFDQPAIQMVAVGSYSVMLVGLPAGFLGAALGRYAHRKRAQDAERIFPTTETK